MTNVPTLEGVSKVVKLWGSLRPSVPSAVKKSEKGKKRRDRKAPLRTAETLLR